MKIKRLFQTFLSFLIFAVLALTVSCSNVDWFGDLSADLEKDLSTEFFFYSDNPDFYAAESDKNNIAKFSKIYTIGQKLKKEDLPSTEDFKNLRPGYVVSGWTVYKDYETYLVKNLITLDYYGEIEKLTVAPDTLSLFANWKLDDHTPYKFVCFLENIDDSFFERDDTYTKVCYGTTYDPIVVTASQIEELVPEGYYYDYDADPLGGFSYYIAPDGSTEVFLYFKRIVSKLNFVIDDGKLENQDDIIIKTYDGSPCVTDKIVSGTEIIYEITGKYGAAVPELGKVVHNNPDLYNFFGWQLYDELEGTYINVEYPKKFPMKNQSYKVDWTDLRSVPYKVEFRFQGVDENESVYEVRNDLTIQKIGIGNTYSEVTVEEIPIVEGFVYEKMETPLINPDRSTVAVVYYKRKSVNWIIYNYEGDPSPRTIKGLYGATPEPITSISRGSKYTFKYWSEDGSTETSLPEKFGLDNRTFIGVWATNSAQIGGESAGGVSSGPIAIPDFPTYTPPSEPVIETPAAAPASKKITFYAKTGYTEYSWYLDGQKISGAVTSSCEIDYSGLSVGVHQVVVLVLSDTEYYAEAKEFTVLSSGGVSLE